MGHTVYAAPPTPSDSEGRGRVAAELSGKHFYGGIEALHIDPAFKDDWRDYESVYSHVFNRRFGRNPTAFAAFMFTLAAQTVTRIVRAGSTEILNRLEELSGQMAEDRDLRIRQQAEIISRIDALERALYEEEEQ